MLGQWNPWFAWTMDLLKSAITLGVTALVTILVVNRIQERLARQRSRADALFQMQMDALREFRQAGATYEVAALSAYVDLYQWTSKDKTAGMQQYEGMAFGNYIAALDGLAQRFGGKAETLRLIADLRQTHEKRHEIYNQLVDDQLDNGPLPDLWERADRERKGFDALLSQARSLRYAIASAVEKDIALVP
jgi:hypothetical protein